MHVMAVGIVRSRVAAVCLFVGGFVLFVCLLFPLMRLAIPRPIYSVGELTVLASVSALVGTVGCQLTGNLWAMLPLFFGLVGAGALMIAGGGSFVAIAIYHPADLQGRGALIAVAMAVAGYILARVLGRRGGRVKNVTRWYYLALSASAL